MCNPVNKVCEVTGSSASGAQAETFAGGICAFVGRPWPDAVPALHPTYSEEYPEVPKARAPAQTPGEWPAGRLISGSGNFEEIGWCENLNAEIEKGVLWPGHGVGSQGAFSLPRTPAPCFSPRRIGDAHREACSLGAPLDRKQDKRLLPFDLGIEVADEARPNPPPSPPPAALSSPRRRWRPGDGFAAMRAAHMEDLRCSSPRSVASQGSEKPTVPAMPICRGPPAPARPCSAEVWCEMTTRQSTEEYINSLRPDDRAFLLYKYKPETFETGSSSGSDAEPEAVPSASRGETALAADDVGPKKLTEDDRRLDELMVQVSLMPTLSERFGEEQPPTMQAAREVSRLPCKQAMGRLVPGPLDASSSASGFLGRPRSPTSPDAHGHASPSEKAAVEDPLGEEMMKLEALPASAPLLLLGGNPFQVPLGRLEPILEEALLEAKQHPATDRQPYRRPKSASGCRIGPTKWLL